MRGHFQRQEVQVRRLFRHQEVQVRRLFRRQEVQVQSRAPVLLFSGKSDLKNID